MDQESPAQIQQIVGAATEALRADLTGALRTEIADTKQHTVC